VAVAAGLTIAGWTTAARAGDLVFGDFENGLDPNLGVVQFNGGPNTFNGSIPDNAALGTMSGSFTTAPGFQQYLRYDNPNKGPGTVAGEINNYNDLAVDINVPGGTDPSAFFLNQFVINATGFGFFQSGDIEVTTPPPLGGQPAKDVKGRGTVTLDWNYRADPRFASDYATFLGAGRSAYFQVLLVSNWGGMDPAIGTFTLDNLRLTNPVQQRLPGDANLDGTVNFTDLLTLAQHYGLSPDAMWADGDFNADGSVGFDDLLTLAQHYGAVAPPSAFAASSVPEPSSFAALGLGAAALLWRGRR
jgi:hypothetical protein